MYFEMEEPSCRNKKHDIGFLVDSIVVYQIKI